MYVDDLRHKRNEGACDVDGTNMDRNRNRSINNSNTDHQGNQNTLTRGAKD